MTATHQQAASGLDSDLSTPRTSLDLTIRCKGGIYAFKHIESLAICYDASKIIPENQGMLAIRAIYKSKRSWNPLELNVAIGRAVVPLEFLLGCPIGCAALEDRFMSDVGALGQTEIEDIATGWGLQEHAPYIAEASSDQSTILWGPRENAQVFHVADLRRTRAGEVLLDTVFQRTRQVGTIRSDAPISQIQHSQSIQRIEHAALTEGPREAWLHLQDYVGVESPVSNFETELQIYDIYCAQDYKTVADIMVRFGRFTVRLIHFCKTGLGKAALEQLFYPLSGEKKNENSTSFRQLVRRTAASWAQQLHQETGVSKTATCDIRVSPGRATYLIRFNGSSWETYDKIAINDGPIAAYLETSWTTIEMSTVQSATATTLSHHPHLESSHYVSKKAADTSELIDPLMQASDLCLWTEATSYSPEQTPSGTYASGSSRLFPTSQDLALVHDKPDERQHNGFAGSPNPFSPGQASNLQLERHGSDRGFWQVLKDGLTSCWLPRWE